MPSLRWVFITYLLGESDSTSTLPRVRSVLGSPTPVVGVQSHFTEEENEAQRSEEPPEARKLLSDPASSCGVHWPQAEHAGTSVPRGLGIPKTETLRMQVWALRIHLSDYRLTPITVCTACGFGMDAPPASTLS